jgi:hypothetical protein
MANTIATRPKSVNMQRMSVARASRELGYKSNGSLRRWIAEGLVCTYPGPGKHPEVDLAEIREQLRNGNLRRPQIHSIELRLDNPSAKKAPTNPWVQIASEVNGQCETDLTAEDAEQLMSALELARLRVAPELDPTTRAFRLANETEDCPLHECAWCKAKCSDKAMMNDDELHELEQHRKGQ